MSLTRFPRRIYTQEEVAQALRAITDGHRHRLRIEGTLEFRGKTIKVLKLIEIAGYTEFFRSYIRVITEIDGLTQLRQSDASIWANRYAVENPADAASMFIQKASLMKKYLEGRCYYGVDAERESNDRRIKFLEDLKTRSTDTTIIAECDRLLDMWRESSLVY